jgi:ATP/maltotriose-dependent transcriptional regulator MalT
MLGQSDDSRLTVIQGPPGTGKTTVIASFVETAIAGGLSGIWLIAQSNVAVKNIAEKLADIGLTTWKLLVSRDFFEGW